MGRITCDIEAALSRNYQISKRARIGVILPSANTGVEYDLGKIRLPGVSWHASRFWLGNSDWKGEAERTGDETDLVFERFLHLLGQEMPVAIRNVLTISPTHIMMGMSVDTFWGGVEGNQLFERGVRDAVGPDLDFTTSATAAHEALQRLGCRRISVITPYPPVGDANVRRFFTEMGYEVHGIVGLNCPTGASIAAVEVQQVVEAVRAVDAPGVDAILQCGTNLSTSDLFPSLEHWLGKPMLPINIVCAWRALRASGIADRIQGLGRLLEDY